MKHRKRLSQTSSRKFSPSALIALLAFSALSSDQCYGISPTWNLNGAGNWNVNGNWTSPATFPNGNLDIANFTNTAIPSGPITIELGQDITTQELIFNNPNTITIDGGGTFHLTFNQVASSIQVAATQTQSITSLVELACGANSVALTVLTNGTDSVLEMSGSIIEVGNPEGSLIKSGTGMLVLSGGNTYHAGTSITGGTLQTASANTMPAGGTLSLSSPTSTPVFDLNGKNQEVGQISSTYAVGDFLPEIHLNGATLTFGNGTPTTYVGNIGVLNDAGKLAIIGGGTITLGQTGVTSLLQYTGGTTITGTTVQAATANNFPAKGVVLLQTTAVLDTGGFDQTIGNLSGQTNTLVKLGTNGVNVATLTVGDASNQTFFGVIEGSSLSNQNGNITKVGTGKLTLTNISPAVNLYTGSTTIGQGILSVSVDGNLGDLSNPVFFESPGGTLEISATLPTARAIILVDSGSVLVDAGKTATLSGRLTGGGTLSLSGPGTSIISGTINNSYSGGTSITGGGLLQISDYRNLGSGPVTFATHANGVLELTSSITSPPFANPVTFSVPGTVFIDAATTATFTGLISGSGLFTKDGAGTLILSGDNTFSGGLTITRGIVQISDDSNLGATGVPITIGAALQSELDFSASTTVSRNILLGNPNALKIFSVLNAGNTVTLSGAITGTSGGSGTTNFVKAGPGRLVLTGANTYTTNTLINNGTLEGTTTGLHGNITNSSSSTEGLVFNQDFDGTYAGNITGTGTADVIKRGPGAVAFTGASNYSAPTTVEAGSLLVNGSVTTGGVAVIPSLTVNSGATLGGTGSVTALGGIEIYGTLSPGNSIGTFSMTGPVTQLPGSNVLIELNPTTSDLTNITGTYTIGGGTTLTVLPDPGTYAAPASYLIVDATGGISGTFTTLSSNAPAMHFSLDYLTGGPDELFLVLDSVSFASAVTGNNANAVAGCADMSTAPPGSDLSNILADLVIQPASVLNDAFNQMQPSAFKSLIVSQQNIMLEVESSLNDRYLAHYKTSCDQNYKQRRSMWLETFGSSQTQGKEHKGGSVQPAYSTKSYGILAGVDTPFGDGFSIGAVTGYTRGNLSLHDNAGHGHVQSAYLGPYAGYNNRHYYINASVLGQANWYETNRKMQFTGVDRTAYSSHMGQGALLHIGGGGWFGFNRFDISPFVNLDYIFMEEDFHSESRAGGLNLRVRSTIYQFTELEGGLLMRTCAKIRQGTIIPEIRLSVIGEFRNQGEDYHASLADTGGCYFTVEGYYPNRVLFSPEAKIKALLYQDRLTASIYYQGKYGASFNQNEIGVTLAWAF